MLNLLVSPTTSPVVYAAARESSGMGSLRLYRSVDGGQSWTVLSRGLPVLGWQITLGMSAPDPARLYLGAQGKLYVSDDGGETWQAGRGFPAGAIAQALVAYAATVGAVWRTDDGGRTWQDWSGGDLRARTALLGLLILDTHPGSDLNQLGTGARIVAPALPRHDDQRHGRVGQRRSRLPPTVEQPGRRTAAGSSPTTMARMSTGARSP